MVDFALPFSLIFRTTPNYRIMIETEEGDDDAITT